MLISRGHFILSDELRKLEDALMGVFIAQEIRWKAFTRNHLELTEPFSINNVERHAEAILLKGGR
jgi:hypothetical protein